MGQRLHHLAMPWRLSGCSGGSGGSGGSGWGRGHAQEIVF